MLMKRVKRCGGERKGRCDRRGRGGEMRTGNAGKVESREMEVVHGDGGGDV